MAAVRWPFFSRSIRRRSIDLALHVKVTDVEKRRVIYEFDMAGGSRGQGHFGTLRASGLGKATPFDLRNAAERVLLVISPDPSVTGRALRSACVNACIR